MCQFVNLKSAKTQHKQDLLQLYKIKCTCSTYTGVPNEIITLAKLVPLNENNFSDNKSTATLVLKLDTACLGLSNEVLIIFLFKVLQKLW